MYFTGRRLWLDYELCKKKEKEKKQKQLKRKTQRETLKLCCKMNSRKRRCKNPDSKQCIGIGIPLRLYWAS